VSERWLLCLQDTSRSAKCNRRAVVGKLVNCVQYSRIEVGIVQIMYEINYLYSRKSLLMDSYVVKKILRSDQHGEGRTWDSNYNPGVDFLDHDVL
jgi:hypothetical protein